MPQNQLILHVGFHKSGTSALQESFGAQRSELMEQGISYPDFGRKAHHRIAWALTQRAWGWKKRGGESVPFKVFTKAANSINRSKASKVVLSSEFFSELTHDQIQKLTQNLKGRQIKILFTLRPLAKLLSSSYQQYLKYGTKADYVKWLHSVLDEPGVSKINPTFWTRHMHGEVISRWVEVFGKENITVLIVDEQRPEFLFESLNSYLGLPAGFLKAQQTGSNRSLSLEEISLLLEINQRFPKERDWSEYLTFIRNGYIRELTDNVPLREGSSKLPTPSWAVEKANSLAAESKKIIQQLGVEVLGSIESLDTAKVLEGEPEYSKSIDIQTVALAMLGFDKKLIRKLPKAWILTEAKRKIKKIFRAGANS